MASWVFDEEVLAVLAAIMVVAAVFSVSQALYAGRVIEPFSELGLLGPAGKIGDYPREAVAGSPFQLNLYVGNHEGKAVYYRILVKVGDNSSIIDASTPLSSEPIIDRRVVLEHNSSKVIPINVTLYKPLVNTRLVFEMWVYDEETGTFKYHGRWNQLWINVKEPSVSASSYEPVATLSPEIERKIAEAYMAVRRAERAGGNITEMVTLLNTAIECANRDHLQDAERLLETILALEPRVAEAGAEFGRLRFYTTITGIIIASSICIGSYLYLRSNIWLLWAKMHKDWKTVRCEDKKGKGERGEKSRGSTKSAPEDDLKIGELISGPEALNPDARRAAKELYKMVRTGLIKIYDPNPPGTFSSFLLSRYNAGFIVTTVIVASGILCIYFSESLSASASYGSFQPLFSTLSAALTFVRYALGSMMVLFLPGYSLIEALYPKGSELSPLERLALSIGLSLALVPLIGLVLNYSPWGIRLNPIVTALALLIILLLLVSAYRKFLLMKSKASSNSGTSAES